MASDRGAPSSQPSDVLIATLIERTIAPLTRNGSNVNSDWSARRCDHRAMSSAVAGGAAGRLVVEPGDRVSAEGRFVQAADGDWLDMARSTTLVFRHRSWKSRRSVRVVGVDAAAVPAPGDIGHRSVLAGRVRVVGVWRDDVISVETQSSVSSPAPPERSKPRFSLPTPAGGWDATDQSTDVRGLDELRASGLIVRDGWYREQNCALVLRAAASDVAAVERVLAGQLPRRLCVVHTRYTATQLREIEDMVNTHHAAWGFEGWSLHGLDAHGQPYAEVTLTRVNADLAAWADTLPDGLLTFDPAMIPA